MRIEAIRIKNFRVFQDVQLSGLPGMVVLVGANGVGKSTFFDLFSFLKDSLEHNVRTALQKRGGFREVVTRGHEEEPIEIEIKYRMMISGRERLVAYFLSLGLRENFPVVFKEILRYKLGRHGSPFHFLDFSEGKGFAITNEEAFSQNLGSPDREEQTLDKPDILAIKGIGQFQRFKAANAFRSLIEHWHVSDFHITAARPSIDAGVAEHLSREGENLALVTQFLHENHPEIFRQILIKMKERVPGISNVDAATTADGRVVLRFQDGQFKDPFIARYVSDGTIKMFAYLVLLHDPSPHPLLAVEEPENQLYPKLLGELAEEFRAYAQRGGQAFISTHSPDFLNAVELNELFWLRKQHGCTTIEAAAQSPLVKGLMDAGDQPGRLWTQGLFEGVDP
ncbi:MAG: AAA family ATPase [Magnetococcales bacterium]|nr:AAA family ATPase [Magnetococcales bacterium]